MSGRGGEVEAMYVPLRFHVVHLALIIVVLLAVIVLIAPGAMAQTGPSAPPAVGVVTVERRPMTESFEFNGRIQAINSVNIVARVTAFLEKRLFEEGSDVKKGDKIPSNNRPFRRPSTSRRPRSRRPKPSSRTTISHSGVRRS